MNRYLNSILVQTKYCREAILAEKVWPSSVLPTLHMNQNQSSKEEDLECREETTGVFYGE
jgi:hypothetical protein